MVDHKSNTLTVTVTADTSAFGAAMARCVKSIQRVELAMIDLEDRRRVRMWDRAQVQALNFEEAMQSIADALAEQLSWALWPVNWVLGVGQDGLEEENTDDR